MSSWLSLRNDVDSINPLHARCSFLIPGPGPRFSCSLLLIVVTGFMTRVRRASRSDKLYFQPLDFLLAAGLILYAILSQYQTLKLHVNFNSV